MGTFEAFINVEGIYSVTVVNTVVHFYNIVMEQLPLEELSVSQGSKVAVLEWKFQDVVRSHCVQTSSCVAPPEKRVSSRIPGTKRKHEQ